MFLQKAAALPPKDGIVVQNERNFLLFEANFLRFEAISQFRGNLAYREAK